MSRPAPTVAASPVDTFIFPAASKPPVGPNELTQIGASLERLAPGVSAGFAPMVQSQIQAAIRSGQRAAAADPTAFDVLVDSIDNRAQLREAVEQGLLPSEAANPWFVKGARAMRGKQLARDAYAGMAAALAEEPSLAEVRDPSAIGVYLAQQRAERMAGLHPDVADSFVAAIGRYEEAIIARHVETVRHRIIEGREVDTAVEVGKAIREYADSTGDTDELGLTDTTGPLLRLAGLIPSADADTPADHVADADDAATAPLLRSTVAPGSPAAALVAHLNNIVEQWRLDAGSLESIANVVLTGIVEAAEAESNEDLLALADHVKVGRGVLSDLPTAATKINDASYRIVQRREAAEDAAHRRTMREKAVAAEAEAGAVVDLLLSSSPDDPDADQRIRAMAAEHPDTAKALWGFRATLQNEATRMRDDPATIATLTERLHDGTLTVADVIEAARQGNVTTGTLSSFRSDIEAKQRLRDWGVYSERAYVTAAANLERFISDIGESRRDPDSGLIVAGPLTGLDAEQQAELLLAVRNIFADTVDAEVSAIGADYSKSQLSEIVAKAQRTAIEHLKRGGLPEGADELQFPNNDTGNGSPATTDAAGRGDGVVMSPSGAVPMRQAVESAIRAAEFDLQRRQADRANASWLTRWAHSTIPAEARLLALRDLAHYGPERFGMTESTGSLDGHTETHRIVRADVLRQFVDRHMPILRQRPSRAESLWPSADALTIAARAFFDSRDLTGELAAALKAAGIRLSDDRKIDNYIAEQLALIQWRAEVDAELIRNGWTPTGSPQLAASSPPQPDTTPDRRQQ